MNISQKISIELGAQTSCPVIDTFFMPLKNDKYIIIDGRSKYDFGVYDYFNDVVDLIYPKLKYLGIDVFYFCNENMQKISCDRCFINLNKKQEAYLISKAKLVVGCENYFLYLAASLGVYSIGLYSVYSPQNTQPFWNKDKQIVLESHREGNLPSYGTLRETPKTVNFISPFEVAKNVLNTLNIENDLHKYELAYLGENYKQKIVEIVPDFTSDERFLVGASVNLRLDYVNYLSGAVLQYWLSNRRANIITDKDINIAILEKFRQNIISITITVSDHISEAFLQQCKQKGFAVKLFCNNSEKLKSYRFKFLDWQIYKDYNEEKKLKNYPLIASSSKFVSSKVIFSKGNQYSCRAAMLLNKPLDKSGESVILNEEFEKELEYFKIYNIHERILS